MKPETEELIEAIDKLMSIATRPAPQHLPGQPYFNQDCGIGETVRVLCTELQGRLAPNRLRDVQTNAAPSFGGVRPY